MGREIRKVAAGWWPPMERVERRTGFGLIESVLTPIPQFDRSLREAQEAWDAEAAAFVPNDECSTYAEWDGERPDDPRYYRPDWTDEERTHVQLYETVSEGTPLTPAFATPAELVTYLCTIGPSWGGPWTRETAERFVEIGWAPSFVVSSAGITPGYEAAI